MSLKTFRNALFERDAIDVKIRGRSAWIGVALRWTGVSWLLDSEPVDPAWFATVVLDANQVDRVIAQLDAIDWDSLPRSEVQWFKDELEEWRDEFRAAVIDAAEFREEVRRRSFPGEIASPRFYPFYWSIQINRRLTGVRRDFLGPFVEELPLVWRRGGRVMVPDPSLVFSVGLDHYSVYSVLRGMDGVPFRSEVGDVLTRSLREWVAFHLSVPRVRARDGSVQCLSCEELGIV